MPEDWDLNIPPNLNSKVTLVMTFSFSLESVHVGGKTVAGVIVHRCSNTAEALAVTVVANPSWNYKPCPGLSLLVKGAGDILHKSRAAGSPKSAQTVPIERILTLTLLNSLKWTTCPTRDSEGRACTSAALLTRRPSIIPSSLRKPSPLALIKVEEFF